MSQRVTSASWTLSHPPFFALLDTAGHTFRPCLLGQRDEVPSNSHARSFSPMQIKPLFAVSPPRTSDGRMWLRCQRGGVLNAADIALLASALDGGAGAHGGSTELVCVSDLLMPKLEEAGRPGSESERGMVARMRVQGEVYAVCHPPSSVLHLPLITSRAQSNRLLRSE